MYREVRVFNFRATFILIPTSEQRYIQVFVWNLGTRIHKYPGTQHKGVSGETPPMTHSPS